MSTLTRPPAPTAAQILADPDRYPYVEPDPMYVYIGRAVEHETGQAPGFYPWALVHTIMLHAHTTDEATTAARSLLGAPTRHDHWHIEWTEITPCRR